MQQITRYGDLGTPELLRRKGIKIDIIEGQPRATRRNISPIHTMHARGQITTSQFCAGRDFNNYYQIAFVGKNSCEIQERIDGSNAGLEMTEGQVYAMRQFERGIAVLKEDELLVRDVCIKEISLTNRSMKTQEKIKRMKRFHLALNRLAKAYGYK